MTSLFFTYNPLVMLCNLRQHNGMLRAVESFLISGLVALLLVVSAPSSSASVPRDIFIDAGRDLVVQSRQNVSSSSNFGFNFNVSFGPSGPTGLSIGGYYGDGNRQYTDSPTTIVARHTLDIYTGRTTYLLGAMLNSKSGDLRLDTDDFIFDHFEDTDKNIQVGTSAGGGISFDLNNLANSDAHGSLQYRNKEGLTYATVGFGQIVVRGDKRDLSGLNRDVENLQVTTQNINFNIAIPGVNLKKLADEIKGAAATIAAATADIPQPIRDRGEQAVDAYRDAILNGLSGAALRKYIASDFFARTVSQRNSWLEAKKSGSMTPEKLARLSYLIGRGEKVFFDENTRQLMIATDCGTSGYGATPCGVPLSSLSSISKDQVLKYINDSIVFLQSAKNSAKYHGTLKNMVECAMAWTIQGGENGFNYMEVARQAIPAGSSYDNYRAALNTAAILAVQLSGDTTKVASLNNAGINLGSALVDIASARNSSNQAGVYALQNLAVDVALNVGVPNGESGDIWTVLRSQATSWGTEYVDSINRAEAISRAGLDARAREGLRRYLAAGASSASSVYQLAQDIGYTTAKGITSEAEFAADGAFQAFEGIFGLAGAMSGARAIAGSQRAKGRVVSFVVKAYKVGSYVVPNRQPNPIAANQGIVKTSDIRDGLSVGSNRTVAYSEVDVTGIRGDVIGVSGQANRGSTYNGATVAENTSRTGPGRQDAEIKILDHLRTQLTPQSSGTIRLFVDQPAARGVCQHCTREIFRFRNDFPLIRLDVSAN